jgi:hypothetical protein
VLQDAGSSYQRTRTWCPTGTAQRKRKSGVVTVVTVERWTEDQLGMQIELTIDGVAVGTIRGLAHLADTMSRLEPARPSRSNRTVPSAS